MKLTAIRTDILRITEDDPLADMPEERGRLRPIVTVRMQTDAGIEGIGLTLWGGAMTGALRTAIDELGALIIGEDPLRIEAIIAKLRAAAGNDCGPAGIFLLALAAIDTALWDIKGKALQQPLWKLLGGHRNRVPAYASGSLRRGLTDDQAATAARRLLDKGFREMKTQMALPGDPSPADELRRVRVVRDAIGPDIKLMCDINQRWRPEQAIDIGKRAEDVGLFWLEDVTACDDYQGLARVTAALSTPIAGGEYVWGITPFRQMIEARSVDIVMIDLARVGGVTPWLKVAGMAEAFNLPVVSHVIPEFHAHLIAAVPNGLTVEYMPWMLKLFEETPRLDHGELVLSEKPGFGLKFDEAAVQSFRVG
ncbi:MAG: mandelate racemase/muconate lactonizing enzyme family protein [Alphaproteobacteria bacterium]|nr:mandelate racemase/muconate lactonizing enzyme family protein [Alphaproteobacteria bacterium]